MLCFAHGTPAKLAPLIELYKKNIVNAEPVGDYVNDNIMVTSQMLCLEDRQRARDIATDMAIGYQNSLVFRYLDTFPKPPGIPTWPEVLPEPTLEVLDYMVSTGIACIGDPDDCTKVVQNYVDIGADQLTFGMLSSTMSREVAVEAVETFGRHVLPAYDKDPVHRTTRQRQHLLGAPVSA